MGEHINEDGKFQSDKYPDCPPGKVPLSTKDEMAQDLLWRYSLRRESVDKEFAQDLQTCLIKDGFKQNDFKDIDKFIEESVRQSKYMESLLKDKNSNDVRLTIHAVNMMTLTIFSEFAKVFKIENTNLLRAMPCDCHNSGDSVTGEEGSRWSGDFVCERCKQLEEREKS